MNQLYVTWTERWEDPHAIPAGRRTRERIRFGVVQGYISDSHYPPRAVVLEGTVLMAVELDALAVMDQNTWEEAKNAHD